MALALASAPRGGRRRAADLPPDIADLAQRQYWHLDPASAGAGLDRLVDELALYLSPHRDIDPAGTSADVSEQLRHAMLGLLQARHRLDETDLDRDFPGQLAARRTPESPAVADPLGEAAQPGDDFLFAARVLETQRGEIRG